MASPTIKTILRAIETAENTEATSQALWELFKALEVSKGQGIGGNTIFDPTLWFQKCPLRCSTREAVKGVLIASQKRGSLGADDPLIK